MQNPRINVLATGFGPFPGMPFNASAALIRSLGQNPSVCKLGAHLHTAVLPTEWRASAIEIDELIRRIKPDAILHFGVSQRIGQIEIETWARNATRPAADHSGEFSQRFYVRRGKPPLLTATVPAARLVRQLRLAGVRASLSRDAGRYLCNATFYGTLCRAQSLSPAPLVGFIHIPALPPYHPTDVSDPDPDGRWSTLENGAKVIIRTTIEAVKERRRHLGGRA